MNCKIEAISLPKIDMKIEVSSDGHYTVYDPLRRRRVALTPEEAVRQHFVAFLVNYKGFPASRIANEVSLSLNGGRRRADTVVYDCCRRPLVIVEYKAPDIVITPDTFRQIASYNLVLQAPWLMVSNGMSHYCCHVEPGSRSCRFLDDIPAWETVQKR